VIALEKIQRRWGTFSLSVTLAVPEGKYMVILGPSGCGKSLLLGTVAGIYWADGGTIRLDGQNMTQEPPEKRGLGFVFQRASLFPHLSVSANIEFGLKVRGFPRAERQARVNELAITLRLQQLMDRPVLALSGGEAQRVAIARALAARPRV